ncbi:MAG TPA: hypothetical protein VH877_19115 [Polyangia bacterium]|nr:hypothetical protein [Polyangia bacterium]
MAIDLEPLGAQDPPVDLRPIAHPLPQLSDDLQHEKQLRAMLCVEPTGEVSQVEFPSPSPLAKSLADVTATLKQWRFESIAVRSCFLMRIDLASAQPPSDAPSDARPKNVPHELDPAEVLYHVDPHLPDNVTADLVSRKKVEAPLVSHLCVDKGGPLWTPTCGEAIFFAKVCIAQSGNVFRVDVLQGIPGADDAIRKAIFQWRYKPQPIPVCFPARWIFQVQSAYRWAP